MKAIYLIFAVSFSLFLSINGVAQVKIGDNPDVINAASILELESHSKGLLIPRMTTAERDAISNPPAGLEIYNTETDHFNYYDGSHWVSLKNKLRDNHVVVKSEADFPTPQGSEIILDSNVVYEINGHIQLTHSLNLNGAMVHGVNVFKDMIEYSGTESIFTGAKGGEVRCVALKASESGAQIFDLSNTDKDEMLIIRGCVIEYSNKIGTIEGYSLIYCSSLGVFDNLDGFTFNGVSRLILNDMHFFDSNHGTLVKFEDNCQIDFVDISGGFYHTSSINNSIAFDFGTNVVLTGSGSMQSGVIGDGTPYVGTPSNKWHLVGPGFEMNADQVACANIYLVAPLITTISTVNTPVKVEGVTSSTKLHRMEQLVNNRITYNGTKTRSFMYNCSVSLTAEADNKVFEFFLAKNGVVLPESAQKRKILTGSDVGNLSISGVVELNPGDYIEVWVANISDNTNITVQNMNLSII